MVNYWAITIGINQYHLFQPLSCAQADAEALKDFLATEAGFLPQNCLLMTDTSPPIMRDKSTYPTRENILLLLEDLAANYWQPQDYLWLFFSGYAINYKGQDYLMPVEGNPDLVQETGIELRSLLQSLQLTELNVLLILDINRAFGTQADAPVGQETLELAQELQLATILSCQPEQFSHESRELGHGFFTAGLLQALSSGHGSNLGNLVNQLSILTPELCQHHWRPAQNPVAVVPSPQQIILPPLRSKITPAKSEVGNVIFPEESFVVARAAPSLATNSGKTATKVQTTSNNQAISGLETTISPKYPPGKPPQFTAVSEKFPNQAAQGFAGNGASQSVTKKQSQVLPSASQTIHEEQSLPASSSGFISQAPGTQVKKSFWSQLLWWLGGSLLILGLVAVVFLRNQTRLKTSEVLTTSSNTTTNEAKDLTNLPNNSTAVSNSTTTAPPTQSPTPKPAPTAKSTPKVTNSESQQRNQAVLDLAKMSLRETQASDLSLAIATARKIQSGEPLYEQAQEDIKIWSRMILDLAEGRAQQKQYANAIAAAQLITKEEELYPKAQALINQWRLEAKQYVSNKTLLDAANALIRPGQASTYNRAIEVAKKVPPGQPGFDVAQKSINQWSEKILDLAKNRAVKGELNAAIETAALIPEMTSAYEDAQEAIQKWQVRRIKN
ncbi:caspase family protein [Tolypothrix sp. FACHB-123]|uniref:caspase family protein n=1 Tax=Tolypothrix sp. FACHB-123 TaxID=2692868 RepID=UPI0016899E78|nr:caspase family protein [Tolypothrix sp. FACHB-123]MBD2356902.1 caspase family protein [Tolypothrix sp. FACHB-123]